MIIDFHTHCFPDELAQRAMGKLSDTIAPLGVSPATDGTISGLLCSMDFAHIEASVVCNVATNARQMGKVNDFAIALKQRYPTKLISLGSLHPHGEGLEAELERLMAAGIRGIKLHPDYQGIDFDAADFDDIFSLCEEKGVFIITHAGFDPLSSNHIHCTPAMVRRVITRHPRLKLVVAHMGGLHCESEALTFLCGQDVYLDTSLLTYRPERADILNQILVRHSPDRLLFATDTPWTNALSEIAAIQRAPLSEEVREMIFFKNALALLSSCQYDFEVKP